jgi:hypothetical protein
LGLTRPSFFCEQGVREVEAALIDIVAEGVLCVTGVALFGGQLHEYERGAIIGGGL